MNPYRENTLSSNEVKEHWVTLAFPYVLASVAVAVVGIMYGDYRGWNRGFGDGRNFSPASECRDLVMSAADKTMIQCGHPDQVLSVRADGGAVLCLCRRKP